MALNGLTGVNPEPIIQSVIDEGLRIDALMNILTYSPIGVRTGINNIVASVVITDTDEGENRAIGKDVTNTDNAENEVINLNLKSIAKGFTVDSITNKGFGSGTSNKFNAKQIMAATAAVKKTFNRDFISGDTATNPAQFDGLVKYFSKNAGQLEDALASAALDRDTAINIEAYINKLVNKLDGKPTFIITTREGKGMLQTLASLQNRGIHYIKVDELEYETYKGIAIIDRPDADFPSTELAKGIPLYLGVVDENNGIFVATPESGNGLHVVIPTDTNNTTGVLVNKGAVEIISVPVIESPYCVSGGYVNFQ